MLTFYMLMHMRCANSALFQALQVIKEAKQLSGQRWHTCLKSDSLHKVMEQLASPGK